MVLGKLTHNKHRKPTKIHLQLNNEYICKKK